MSEDEPESDSMQLSALSDKSNSNEETATDNDEDSSAIETDADADADEDLKPCDIELNSRDTSVESLSEKEPKPKPKPKIKRVRENLHKKVSETRTHRSLSKIDVPLYGDCFPQSCIVAHFNYQRKLNDEEERELSHFNWSLSNMQVRNMTKNKKYAYYACIAHEFTTSRSIYFSKKY